jgi:hypothetical protein
MYATNEDENKLAVAGCGNGGVLWRSEDGAGTIRSPEVERLDDQAQIHTMIPGPWLAARAAVTNCVWVWETLRQTWDEREREAREEEG